MKKVLFCITAAALFTTASVYAADIQYNSEEPSVTYTNTEATDKKNVIIYNSDDTDITIDDVIYINQSDTELFTETTKFFTKQNPAEGKYTIKMSDGKGTEISSDFYVGMNVAANDIKMTKRTRPDETVEEGHVRYACRVSGTRDIKTVIVKMNGEYYGFELPEGVTWSVSSEAAVIFGVEIVADGEGESIDQITDVWLSERALTVDGTTGKGTLTKGTQTSNESTQEEA